MDKKILKKIIENKQKFIPYLFTAKQIKVIEKYLNKTGLTRTEKTYLYSTIKKKTDALSIIKEEFYINGQDMILERVKKAKEILNQINKNAFISGTFLFSKKYNDIDIYIISNKRKQYHRGKLHYIFITKEDLKKPIFISAAKYNVSNFFIELEKPIISRAFFDDIIMTYEMAINEILDNDDQKTIRNIIFEYHMHIKGTILDSFSLYKKSDEIIQLKSEDKIKNIHKMTKELIKLFSNSYVYNRLVPFVKSIKKTIPEFIANDNLIIYRDFLNEVKNGCRRAKT